MEGRAVGRTADSQTGREKFLPCSYYSGLVREACVMEKEGKQELRCCVCISGQLDLIEKLSTI